MGKNAGQLTFQELEMIKTLKAGGLTIHKIARTLQRDDKTVQKALDRPGFQAAVVEVRKTLIEKNEAINHRCLDAVLLPGEIERMTPDKKIVAAAVCTDKARLLNNESTANIAIGGLNSMTMDQLLSELADLRRRAGDDAVDITPERNRIE
jgi:DNA-binding transcriptional MerR regulator